MHEPIRQKAARKTNLELKMNSSHKITLIDLKKKF